MIRQGARMRLRRLGSLCLISFACLVFTLALAGLSFATSPWDHRISFTHGFHVGVWNCRIMFFNDADYGPYRGSIIHLSGADGILLYRGSISREVRDKVCVLGEYGFVRTHYVDVNSAGSVMQGDTYCELPAISHRHFASLEPILWTLMVSLAYPAVIFSVLPLIWCARGLKHRHWLAPTRSREPPLTPSGG